MLSYLDTPEPKPEERTYAEGVNVPYTLPNDAPEHVRLESQAVHLKAIMNNNIIHSPISSPSKIVDVGCGTGVVTTDIATKFPNAKVYGLDLSPVPQISDRTVPSNVQYVLGNIMDLSGEDEGTKSILDGGFDLVFSRLLACGLTDWPGYIRKATNMLNPGTGWLEAHEIHIVWFDEYDNPISDDWEWCRIFHDAAAERSLDTLTGGKVAGWMQDAGLVDVQTTIYRWAIAHSSKKSPLEFRYKMTNNPIGPMGGEWETTPEMRAWGNFVPILMPRLFGHMFGKITERKGYDRETIERWNVQMKEDFKPAKGKHMKFYVTRGRKPA